jgi:cardiolipin synthase
MSRSRRPASKRAATHLVTAGASAALAVLISRNFFRTEKTLRRKIVTDYAACDPTFGRMMSDLLGPPLLEGNRVEILQNGDEIFPSMVRAIQSAQKTITFENFVFTQGRVSDEFAEALAERARQGVKVHFLQDALGCDELDGRGIRLMKSAGVEVEIFRSFKLTEMNFRTHRKILVIDGGVAFLGGVGISDGWSGAGETPGLWRDTQYRVEGPVAAQAQSAFMDNWMQTRAEVLHGNAYFPQLSPVGRLRCQVFKSSASEGAESARLMFLLSMAAARKSILIANAYFVPDNLMRETLVDACRRGVRVEIITTGPDIDQQTVRLAGRERWAPLLEAGARIFEYQPARFHCKYLIVDGCWCSVGSANLDNRSLRLNEEANLNILDEQFAAAHSVVFEQDKHRSREVTMAEWRCRPFREILRGQSGLLLRKQI